MAAIRPRRLAVLVAACGAAAAACGTLVLPAGAGAAVSILHDSPTLAGVRTGAADWWIAKTCSGPDDFANLEPRRTLGPGYVHVVSADVWGPGSRSFGNVVDDGAGLIANDYGMTADGGLLSFSFHYARRPASATDATLSPEVGNDRWPPNPEVNNWPVSSRWCAADGGGGFGVVDSQARGPYLVSVGGPQRAILEVTVRIGVPFIQEEYNPAGPMPPAGPDGTYRSHLVELVYRYALLDDVVRVWVTTRLACDEETCGDRDGWWQFVKEPKFSATVAKGIYPNFALYDDAASSAPSTGCVRAPGAGGGTTGPAGGPSPSVGIAPATPPPTGSRFPSGPAGLCLFGAAKHPLSATWQFHGDDRLQAGFVFDDLGGPDEEQRFCDETHRCLRIRAQALPESATVLEPPPAEPGDGADTGRAFAAHLWERPAGERVALATGGDAGGPAGLGGLAAVAAGWEPFAPRSRCADSPTSPNVTRWEAIGHWGTADTRPFDRADHDRGVGAGPPPAWFFHAWEGGNGPNDCASLFRHVSTPVEVASYFELSFTSY